MLSESCCEFILEVLGIHLDEVDRLWFFSDWSSAVPRTFEERLWDHCVSHGVFSRSVAGGRVEN